MANQKRRKHHHLKLRRTQVTVPPDPSSEVSLLASAITDVVSLLGLAGVAVPAFLQSPSTVLQIAGAIVAVVGIGLSYAVKTNLRRNNAALRTRASLQGRMPR